MACTMDVTLTRRTVFGPGRLAELGELCRPLGERALIVIGGGSVKRTGALDKARRSLTDAGVEWVLFEGVEPDPSVDTTDRAVAMGKSENCDLVIGLGGGSVMDCAKAVALLITHEGPTADYQMDRREVERPGLPYVAVSTTSGTGSEANRVAVLTNKEERIKKALLHPYMVPQLALLDPELTLSLPQYETAYTGIDALSHAAESYVSLGANPLTEAYGLRALELIADALPKAIRNPEDVDARADMAMANYLGGAALNGGVGAAHILAHPLGAEFGIPHGTAIAALLPQVFDANCQAAPRKYARIYRAFKPDVQVSDAEAASRAGDALREFLSQINFAPALGEHDVDEGDFEKVYEGVQKSMAHVVTNPRPAGRELLREILVASL